MTIPPLVRKHGPTVFGVLLLLGALYVVQREFRELSITDVSAALDATSSRKIWFAALWTLLAYAVLTVYDRLGSVYAGKPISYARTALASFCAYTMAHNLGFAAVSGAAVRYRFYAAWDLTPAEIAKVIAFTSLTFGLGGFALGGLVLFTHPEVLPWVGDGEVIPSWTARVVALIMWTLVVSYVVLSRFLPHFTAFGHKVDLPGLRLAISQVILASVDVAVTAMIFYVLLPDPPTGAPPLTFLMFLGIYVAGYTAGLAASVPGGLGVFDGFIMLSLSPWLPGAQVVGALLLFRLFYYIIPLFVAGALFASFEMSQRKSLLSKVRTEARVTDALEVPAIAGLAGLTGAVMLFIGALPGRGGVLAAWVGEWTSLASQFAASVVGSLLLVVAWGMLRRLRIAWYAGLVLLLNGIGILVVRADPWLLIVAVVAVVVLLTAMRAAFYRDARLTSEPLTSSRAFSLAAGTLCGLTLATVAYHGHVSDAAWWEVVLSADAPAPLRFAVGLAGVLLLFAAFRLLRPARITAEPYDVTARSRLRALGARAPEPMKNGAPLGALFAEGGRAGFAFRRYEDVWLALGDPAGEPQARVAAVWRFRDLCDAAGVEAAFADIGRGMQRAYEDAGLTAIPLPSGRTLACRAEHKPDHTIALAEAEYPSVSLRPQQIQPAV